MKLTLNDKPGKPEYFADLPIGQVFRWVNEAKPPSILMKIDTNTVIVFGHIYNEPKVTPQSYAHDEVIRYTIDEIIAHRS